MSPLRRERVELRARYSCEYCHAPMRICAYTFHVEHCVPRSRGGADADDNLAQSGAQCNLKKGGQIAAADRVTCQQAALFNPRRERWAEHFRLRGSRVEGLTPVGRATVILLDMDSAMRQEARAAWRATGLWP